MHIKKTFRVKLDFSSLFIIIGILFVVGYVIKERANGSNQRAMKYHCSEINKDPTRSFLRTCIKPVSLKEGFFVFKTKGGDEEHYFIIAENNDVEDISVDQFSYNFIK